MKRREGEEASSNGAKIDDLAEFLRTGLKLRHKKRDKSFPVFLVLVARLVVGSRGNSSILSRCAHFERNVRIL